MGFGLILAATVAAPTFAAAQPASVPGSFAVVARTASGGLASNVPVDFAVLPSTPAFAGVDTSNMTIASIDHPTPGSAGIHFGSHKTQTDAMGQARFVPTAAERSMAANNNGWLNIQSMSLDGNGMPLASTVTPIYLGTDSGQAAEASRMMNGPVSLTEDTAMQTAMHSASAKASAAGGLTPMVSATDSCINLFWSQQYVGHGAGYDWNWTVIGEIHDATDVQDNSFQYGIYADSNVDEGFKFTSGLVELGADVHIGTSIGTKYYAHNNPNDNWWVEAPFYFNQYALYGYCQSNNWNLTYMGEWMVLPTSYNNSYGIIRSGNPAVAARNSGYTTDIFWNGGWARTSSALIDYSGVVSVAGISLGGQTGASVDAEISYQFTGSENHHYIYGDNALPNASRRVYEANH